MKNGILWMIALCAVIIVILIAIFFQLNKRPPASARPSSADTTGSLSPVDKFIEVPLLTDTERSDMNPAGRYAYNVHFPSISLLDHPQLAKETNTVISVFVDDIVTDFRKAADAPILSDVPKDLSSDLTMRWSAEMLSPTVISIRFDFSEYIAGAAHQNSLTRILNYDIERHAQLATADLFASSSEAFLFLSEYARKDMEQRMNDATKAKEDQSMFTTGTEPTSENFSAVGITKSGLLVVFNPYQVAPYARGAIELPIPLTEVRLLLAPRIIEAIGLANTNIREATPENPEAPENGL